MAKKTREPLEVVVDALHDDGFGTANQGKVGITGALPGERVIAQPFTRKKKRLFARTIDVLEPSPDRVTPICAAASVCGGCSLQHMDPVRQLALKEAKLRKALGDAQPDSWLPPLIGPVSHYRSKARLAVKAVPAKGRVLVGFREKMQPFVADMTRCEVLVPPLDGMIEALSALIGRLSVAAALPQIEVAMGDEHCALVFRHLQPLTDEDVEHVAAFGDEWDIDVYLQSGGPDTVSKLTPAGEERLIYRLPEHQIEMAFHPMDFTQVNQAINRQLVNLAIELLQLEPTHHVLDLFCGIGNFTLPIARHVAGVHGVELSATSVDRGRENAQRNMIRNATFETADLFDGLRFPAARPDRVLLDPPRSGASAVCQGLAEQKVQRVVYVSCNPVTLAEDVKVLTESGYRLEHAGVIDMFPHTAHVESIACLSADP